MAMELLNNHPKQEKALGEYRSRVHRERGTMTFGIPRMRVLFNNLGYSPRPGGVPV